MSPALSRLLRLEGLAAFAAAAAVYFKSGYSWSWFVLAFLAPDLVMLGYLGGARAGAVCYNAAHTYVGPLVLLTGGWLARSDIALSVSLIWTAHIGLDRSLGYGLKYADSFRRTHLGAIGREPPQDR